MTHYKQTSEEPSSSSYEELGLPKIDLAFIDGNHAMSHVDQDVVAMLQHGHENTYFLLHDTNIYIRELLRHAGVKALAEKEGEPQQGGLRIRRFPLGLGRGRWSACWSRRYGKLLLILAALQRPPLRPSWPRISSGVLCGSGATRRGPPRAGENFVSPADGTVVYVKRAAANEPMIVCKQGKAASIDDIAREGVRLPKILIGIFMSPLERPLQPRAAGGGLDRHEQYPAVGKNLHMGSMHWRSIWRRLPIYVNSPHILQNNRAVTRFCGSFRGARDLLLRGPDRRRERPRDRRLHPAGQRVEKGEIFGMIRVGSQVDLIVPDLPG